MKNMMKDKLVNAAISLENETLTQWKADRKKVVGYTCSFMPCEIIHAAGILPYRLRGIQTEGMEIADAYYGPFVCSYPKCILQLAGKGKFHFLDGAIITPGCDSMRRMDECWRKAGEDYDHIVPSYFYYFDVPHKKEPHGMAWYKDEIYKLKKSIENHFQVKITENALHESICQYNKGRQLLRRLEEIRKRPDVLVSGTDAFAVFIASTVLPRHTYNEWLETYLAELENSQNRLNGRKRIMVVGSVSDDIDLIKGIEDSGAIVVTENLCFGIRNESDQVDETIDPVAAIANRYLDNSICPRMYGGYKQRLDVLKQKVESAKVDGVILQNVRFCDLHGSENGVFERDLEKQGIACMRLEREYGSVSGFGRMKMRIDAFLERIA